MQLHSEKWFQKWKQFQSRNKACGTQINLVSLFLPEKSPAEKRSSNVRDFGRWRRFRNAAHPTETPLGRDKQEHHCLLGCPPPAQGNRTLFPDSSDFCLPRNAITLSADPIHPTWELNPCMPCRYLRKKTPLNKEDSKKGAMFLSSLYHHQWKVGDFESLQGRFCLLKFRGLIRDG